MTTISINELHLQNYRNFDTLSLKTPSKQIIITGDNGVGKTNILESISLLSPGRGLRYAKLEELCKGELLLRSSVTVNTLLGGAKIDTCIDPNLSRRVIEFNGKKIPHTELSNLISIIWLTPQMDGLFRGPSSDRRKFLDRACYAFFQNHAKLISQYEHFLKERMKILESTSVDYTWLDMIEEKISTIAEGIHKNRTEVVIELQEAIDSLGTLFPKGRLTLDPDYSNHDASWFKSQFKEARRQDALSGRSSFGVHRSDLVVYYAKKDILTKHCSTGEQKAILISVTIAQVVAKMRRGDPSPIMLFDETFVHLDALRREYLADFMKNSSSQVWITSAESDMSKYFKDAQMVEL